MFVEAGYPETNMKLWVVNSSIYQQIFDIATRLAAFFVKVSLGQGKQSFRL